MKLTQEGKDLLSYIDSLIPENGHLEYDFRDSRQYEFAKMLKNEHFDTARYPGILKSLEIQLENQEKNGMTSGILSNDNGFQNFFGISGLGLDPNTQNIATNGLGTTVGGYSIMSLVILIKDNQSGNIIASGNNNDMAGTLLPVATPASSGSNNLNVTSYLQYSATPNGGSPVSGIVKQTGYNTPADPQITAPVRRTSNPKHPEAINIGLARHWTDQGGTSGFDYAWNEPPQNNPVGKIPFVGHVIFSQPIKALDPKKNFLLQIYVANKTNGGVVTLQSTNLDDVYASFSIDGTNPNKLNWTLNPGKSTSDKGNPITFQNITWPSDMDAIFHCSILVTLQDGTFGSAIVESTTTRDDDPLDGTLGIMPISFIWHCLGEGSQVIMGDGSKKPIEDILAGEKVCTDRTGTVKNVEWTNKGIHFGSAYKIRMQNGNEIIATDNHVFSTGTGLVAAAELKVGQALQMADGKSEVFEIEHLQDYEGMFYNLATSTVEQTEKGEIGTFIANGFQVGDVNAQKAHRNALSNNIEWVKEQVPEYLHQDVDSFFEDKAYK